MVTDDYVKYLSSLLDDVLSSSKYANAEEQVVTDIYIQPLLKDKVLNVYDDDVLLSSCQCDWLADFAADSFYDDFKEVAASAIRDLKSNRKFDRLGIFQPFSFVLLDEDKEQICDIDIVDDDTIVLSDKLLKGWETELDEFIKKLLDE